jgi:hypothetical protein
MYEDKWIISILSSLSSRYTQQVMNIKANSKQIQHDLHDEVYLYNMAMSSVK